MHATATSDLVVIVDWIQMKHPDAASFDLDTDLIESRLLDSLDFAEFLFVLEETTGSIIDLQDVDLDTFRTLRSIEAKFLSGGEARV